jgi:hypothetical protein
MASGCDLCDKVQPCALCGCKSNVDNWVQFYQDCAGKYGQDADEGWFCDDCVEASRQVENKSIEQKVEIIENLNLDDILMDLVEKKERLANQLDVVSGKIQAVEKALTGMGDIEFSWRSPDDCEFSWKKGPGSKISRLFLDDKPFIEHKSSIRLKYLKDMISFLKAFDESLEGML